MMNRRSASHPLVYEEGKGEFIIQRLAFSIPESGMIGTIVAYGRNHDNT
jgi:hypothetical protein